MSFCKLQENHENKDDNNLLYDCSLFVYMLFRKFCLYGMCRVNSKHAFFYFLRKMYNTCQLKLERTGV